MKKHILFLCGAMAICSPALAEEWYVDGGLGFVSFDDSVDKVSPTNIYIRGGYIITPNFNVGVEANVTISPDQLPGSIVNYSVDMGTVYVRGGAPVSDSVRIYAQIGSTNTTLTGELAGFSTYTEDNDLMIGFGAEIDLGSGPTYLAINYSIYYNNEDVDVTGFNIGAGARF